VVAPQAVVQAPAAVSAAEPLAPETLSEGQRPGIPQPFQLLDIHLWQYGVALLVLLVSGLGAWLLHLRGARW
jgi:hypothetical protein